MILCTTTPNIIRTQKCAIQVIVDGFFAVQSSTYFYYNENVSPDLFDISPNVVTPGSPLTLRLRTRVKSLKLVSSVTLTGKNLQGPTRCLPEFLDDEDTTNKVYETISSTGNLVQCNIASDFPAGFFDLNAYISNLGNANINPKSNFQAPDGEFVQVMVVPEITKISTNMGSRLGGIVEIWGKGLSALNQATSVKLGDTIEATILEASSTYIKAKIPEFGSQLDNMTSFVGHAGVIGSVWYDRSDYWYVRPNLTFQSTPDSQFVQLATALPDDGSSRQFIRKFDGYFVARATGNHRFFTSGDDYNEIALETTPGDGLKTIAKNTYSPYNEYFYDITPGDGVNPQRSENIYLQAGERRKIQFWHVNSGSVRQWKAAAILPSNQSTIANPPEVWSLQIVSNQTPEVNGYTISINGTSSSKCQWRFNYQSGGTSSYVSVTAEASVLQTAIWNFPTNVTRVLYDSKGSVTTDLSIATKIYYNISYLVNRGATDSPPFSLGSNCGGVKVTRTLMVKPSAPVTGSFSVQIAGSTVTFPYNEYAGNIEYGLRTVIPLQTPISVSVQGVPSHGQTFIITFNGYNTTVPRPTSFDTTLLKGGIGKPTVNYTILQNMSNDQYLDPINAHYLRTAHTVPQITVDVGDIRAACTKMNCDYKIANISEIPTIVSLTSNANTELTLELENAANLTTKDITYVSLGDVGEAQVVSLETSGSKKILKANLPSGSCIPAGSYKVLVNIAGLGFTNYSATTQPLSYTATVSSISPTTGPTTGYTDLVISGQGFGCSLQNPYNTSVTIDGNSCVIKSLSNTQITCTVPASSNAGAKPIKITVNGKDATGSIGSFVYSNTDWATISSLSPTQANPITKTQLTISGTNFPTNNPNQVRIYLDDRNNASNTGVATCNLNSITSTQILCTLSGGVTGNYRVRVLFGTSGMALLSSSNSANFDYVFAVSSISPSSGSVLGGTLLTITGQQFLAGKPESHAVQFGSTTCDIVEVTSTTQMKCVTRPNADPSTTDVPLTAVVMTRFIAQATCTGTCTFKYDSSTTPKITAISPTSGIAGDTITLSGANLGPAEVLIQGVNATVTGSQGNQITFTIPNSVAGANLTLVVNVKGVGLANYTGITPVLNVNQNITDINPKNVSMAGANLVIEGSGFSDQSIVLVNNANCSVISANATQIVCRAAGTKTNGAVLNLQLFASQQAAAVKLNPVTWGSSPMKYFAANTPQVSAILNSSGLNDQDQVAGTFNLTLKGTNLNAAAPEAFLQLFNTGLAKTVVYKADLSSAVQNSTQVSGIVFTNIPAGVYNLSYTTDSGYANFTNNTIVVMPQPISVNSIQSSLVGGNVLTISGQSFPTNTSGNWDIDVRVGGVSAEVVNRTETQIQVRVPAFLTPETIVKAALFKESLLTGTVIANAGASQPAFDGRYDTYYQCKSMTSCYIGYSFGTTVAARLTKFRWMPYGTVPASTFIGARIEGSDDGITWFTLYTFDAPLDTWNTITFDSCSDIRPYSQLRFIDNNSAATTWAIAEVEFHGYYVSRNYQAPLTIPAAIADGSGASGVLDGDSATGYTSTSSGACFIGIDLGASNQPQVTTFDWYVPSTASSLSAYQSIVLQGSNDGTSYTNLTTFTIITKSQANRAYLSPCSTSYRYYRLYDATGASKCSVSEIKASGFALVGGKYEFNANVTVNILGTLYNDGTSVNGQILNKVTYKETLTPVINHITPEYGTLGGGTTVTLTGTGFSASSTLSDAEVKIGGVPCTVTSITSQGVVCQTTPLTRNSAPNTLESQVQVWVKDKGYAGNSSISFLFAEEWSNSDTWGGEAPPLAGETVIVPEGMSLIVDVPNVTVYALIVSKGALIFKPDMDIDFHANYIFISEGRFQIGTEQQPATGKITITMHGKKTDKALPDYGNKVIALREGYLDIHGKPRVPTWTMLQDALEVGGDTITLTVDTDWGVGDVIVIASTSHKYDHSEQFTIVQKNSARSFKLNKPAVYKHYAGIQMFNGEKLEMRAEVGLLTRNIIIQGDSDSEVEQYGAHIMIHSPGDESSVGRISYVEVRQAGQAFQLGRYPIHFHRIGTVTKSYIKGNAIHHTYNRATTIHAVHHLTVADNVVYYCKGHNIFIEDAIETYNLIENNLVITTLPSNSLLNTDQTPASFWITNPKNIFRNNHAAGSARYGFWFDLQDNPTGPSYTPNICPRGERLLEFSGNVAHSNGRYGLRIFHEHSPRTNPCGDVFPTSANPPIPARYENFLGYKNMRSGIIAETLGVVRFSNITVADNWESGVEITMRRAHYDILTKSAYVENVLAVGMSANSNYTEEEYNNYFVRPLAGVVSGQRDGFLISNIRFHNFPVNTSALRDCSHCDFTTTLDTGARTIFTRGLSFADSVEGWRIKYQQPWKGIWRDEDGTLVSSTKTGFSASSGWATYFYPHLYGIPGCKYDEWDTSTTRYDLFNETYNGMVCDDSVTLRKIVFFNVEESLLGIHMKVLRLPDGETTTFDQLNLESQINPATGKNYVASKTFSDFAMTVIGVPGKSWSVVFATGYAYGISLGDYGVDWKYLTLNTTELYEPNDKTITLRFNTSEYKEKFNVWLAQPDKLSLQDVQSAGTLIPNMTLNKGPVTSTTANWNITNGDLGWTSTSGCLGDWYHDADHKYFYMAINGNTTGKLNGTWTSPKGTALTAIPRPVNTPIFIQPISCELNCPSGFDDVPKEDRWRLWSNKTDWQINENDTNASVPVDGSAVVIQPTWNMYIDVDTANLGRLEIQGNLKFHPNKTSLTLKAQSIWVRGGLYAGNRTANEINANKINIILTGGRQAPGIVLPDSHDVGNKAIIVTGTLDLYGKQYPKAWTRLAALAVANSSTITLTPGFASAWNVNDTIIIAPSYQDPTEAEEHTIKSISGDTITLNSPLSFDHYGCSSPVSTPQGDFDYSAEVANLNRNIVIQGSDEDNWGGSMYVTEFVYKDPATKLPVKERGTLRMRGVQLEKMGQQDMQRAGLHLESISLNGNASIIEDSVVAHSNGMNMVASNASNIAINNSIFYSGYKYNVYFPKKAYNITFTNNLVMSCKFRPGIGTIPPEYFKDFGGNWCAVDGLYNSSIQNNSFVAGYYHNVLIATSTSSNKNCQVDPEQYGYLNNYAHSSEYNIYAKSPGGTVFQCIALNGNWRAYGAFVTSFSTYWKTKQLILSNLLLSDSKSAIDAQIGGNEGTFAEARITNLWIAGLGFAKQPCAANFNFSKQKAGVTPLDPSQDFRQKACDSLHGIKTPLYTEAAKDYEPEPAHMPWYHQKTTSSFMANWYYSNITLANFYDDAAGTSCKGNYAVVSNKDTSDAAPVTFFQGFTFQNVSTQNKIYFTSAPAYWIQVENCGSWACTGIKNILIKDVDGSFYGGQPTTFIPVNEGVVEDKTECGIFTSTSFACPGKLDWAYLIFESNDYDKETRLFSPVNITSVSSRGTFRNDLNTYMDHAWDGFYTSMRRLSRFNSLVRYNSSYNISFTGTIPNELRFQLHGTDLSGGKSPYIIVSIKYEKPNSIRVLREDKNNLVVKPIVLSSANPDPVVSNSSTDCGDHIYNFDTMTIQFKLKASPVDDSYCKLLIQIWNSVKLNGVFDMSIDEFWAKNGTGTLVDRLVAVLGISYDRIRIVSVKTVTTATSRRRLLGGSQVSVDFVIDSAVNFSSSANSSANTTEEIEKELEEIAHKVVEASKSGNISIDGSSPAVTYTVIVVNTTATSSNNTTPITPVPTHHEGWTAGTVIFGIILPSFIIAGIVVYCVLRKYKQRRSKIVHEDESHHSTVVEMNDTNRLHTPSMTL